jgi:hypothetical protein
MSSLLSNFNMQKKLESANCGIYKKDGTALLFNGDVFTDVDYNPCRLIL